MSEYDDYDEYMDYDDVYTGAQRSDENRFTKWLKHSFRQRRLAYITSTILIGLLAWWSGQWVAPILYLFVFFTVVKIMEAYQKRGMQIVIESRLQGELITHCQYYEKPILVPHSSIRIWGVPNSRLKDVLAFGDDTPPVHTHSISFVDYFEPMPNGDIVMVHPRDANFGNFSLYARLNPDLAEAMKEVGEHRMQNQALRDAVLDMYKDGRFGDDEAKARATVGSILMDVQAAEKKFSGTAAANRSLWMLYKDTIPRQNQKLLMMHQDIPRIAMAEAAKLTHVLNDHPMGRETYARIQQMLEHTEVMDYDERVRDLVKRGQKQSLEDGLVRRANTHGEVTHVRT